jgi:hypothetical protein
MLGPPQLWTVLTTQWCPVPPPLAWCWWRAILRARWSLAVQWREAFLAKARTDAALTRGEAAAFLGELASLPALVTLVEQLLREQVLLKPDGHKIINMLLDQADATGQWKHLRDVERSPR